MKKFWWLGLFVVCLSLWGCDVQPTADDATRMKQEVMEKQVAAQLGLPGITKFSEKRLLKQILEMRDQGVSTYTYLQSDHSGKLIFLGHSIGFGIPAATQYTNPMKHEYGQALPQADPNGLFSPASAEGTWILMKDPHSDDVKPVYIEPRILVSPFEMPSRVLER